MLGSVFWVNAGGLERYVDLKGQAIAYGARWSGPIDNPDEVAAKVLIYGVAPYDAVGLATLSWNYLDPEKWTSLWAYVPVLRRVRRLAAANTSDGLFGSHYSRDDAGTFSGKIHYFTWKLIGQKEALVPYSLPTPKRWQRTERGLLLPANESVPPALVRLSVPRSRMPEFDVDVPFTLRRPLDTVKLLPPTI